LTISKRRDITMAKTELSPILTDTIIKMDYSADVQRLKLAYLTAAKGALEHRGRDFVETAFGMTDPLLSWIKEASAEELLELSQSEEFELSSRLPVGTRH
jgi:hypothetical protein